MGAAGRGDDRRGGWAVGRLEAGEGLETREAGRRRRLVGT